MRDLLKMEKCQRMLYLRLFLCMNAYPNISAETFNEVGMLLGQEDGAHNTQGSNFDGQNTQNTIMDFSDHHNMLDTPSNAHAGIAAI